MDAIAPCKLRFVTNICVCQHVVCHIALVTSLALPPSVVCDCSNMMTGGGSAGREVLGGIGVDEDNAAGPSANGQNGALPGPPAKLTVAQLEEQLKQQEKAAKRARKEAKKVSCWMQVDL